MTKEWYVQQGQKKLASGEYDLLYHPLIKDADGDLIYKVVPKRISGHLQERNGYKDESFQLKPVGVDQLEVAERATLGDKPGFLDDNKKAPTSPRKAPGRRGRPKK